MRTALKKKFKKASSILVVGALAAVCVVSVTGERMRDSGQSGRMIAINELYAEPAQQNAYAKISYDQMEDMRFESDQLAQLEVDENSHEENLLAASDQQTRDQKALQALMESNSIRAAVEERESKYQLNEITEVKDTTVEVAGLSPVAVPVLGDTEGAEYMGEFVLTAYCPCVICCGNTSGITASGARATANHTIAADRRFAFGTKLLINGIVYTVEDRGGAIKGNHIDVFFTTHQEALQFGKQSAQVYKIP